MMIEVDTKRLSTLVPVGDVEVQEGLEVRRLQDRSGAPVWHRATWSRILAICRDCRFCQAPQLTVSGFSTCKSSKTCSRPKSARASFRLSTPDREAAGLEVLDAEGGLWPEDKSGDETKFLKLSKLIAKWQRYTNVSARIDTADPRVDSV